LYVDVEVWDFETVDSADITGEMECFEMEPMNELKVGPDVQLRCIVKSCDHDEASIWYAQVDNLLSASCNVLVTYSVFIYLCELATST